LRGRDAVQLTPSLERESILQPEELCCRLSPPKTRTRSIAYIPKGKGRRVTKTWNVLSPSPVYTASNVSFGKGTLGRQVTTSEGHPWPPRKGVFRGDLGGDFTTSRQTTEDIPASGSMTSQTLVTHYDFYGQPSGWRETEYFGDIYPMDPSSLGSAPYPPAVRSSDAVLNKLGATAVALVKPTNSVADLSVALGEIVKDGIPSMIGLQTWQNRSSRAKQAGGEYLNVEFGWKPLVSDVMKFADATRRADAILAQYQRDSGRVVRRRMEFPTVTSTQRSVIRSNTIPYGTQHSDLTKDSTTGTLYRTRETVRRQWFSGAFTYYLPPADSSAAGAVAVAALKAKKLYGLTLTPDTLWNLTPWSWAVDWFTNAGDVISNLTDYATDGLVMRYGYIMEHTRVSDIYTLEGFRYKTSSAQPAPLTFTTEVKVRRRANPFGFGVTWEGLTPRQLAIAAALGLSKFG
jgi:hypothetical protein